MRRLAIRTVLTLLVLMGHLHHVAPVQADTETKFRARAREHFEWVRLTIPGEIEPVRYFGLTNTLNLWMEKPFHYAIGFAGGPMLGSATATSEVPAGFDPKARFWHAGVEAKYWIIDHPPSPFVRGGVLLTGFDACGDSYFSTCDDGLLKGIGAYAGVGLEFMVWKIGVAPEFALRQTRFENGAKAIAITPSIGFHFYVFAPESP